MQRTYHLIRGGFTSHTVAQVYPTVACSIRCNIYPKRGGIAESGVLLHAPATSGYLRASGLHLRMENAYLLIPMKEIKGTWGHKGSEWRYISVQLQPAYSVIYASATFPTRTSAASMP